MTVGAPLQPVGPVALQLRHEREVVEQGRAGGCLPVPPPVGRGSVPVDLSACDEDALEAEVDEIRERAGGEIVAVPERWQPAVGLQRWLVESILRRVDHRGSDVRLDLGVVYRPCAWPRTSVDLGKWTWQQALSTPWAETRAHSRAGASCWAFGAEVKEQEIGFLIPAISST